MSRERESVEDLLAAYDQSNTAASTCLVNCAGVNSPTPYFEISDEDWNRVIQYEPDQHSLGLPDLRQAHGRSRRRGDSQHRQRHELSAALASVRLLGLEGGGAEPHAKRRPRVRPAQRARELLCPGFFPAEQNRKILDKCASTTSCSQTPMGRFGEPSELVGAALLLLSPKAGSFITGEAIYVDGGFTAMTILACAAHHSSSSAPRAI